MMAFGSADVSGSEVLEIKTMAAIGKTAKMVIITVPIDHGFAHAQETLRADNAIGSVATPVDISYTSRFNISYRRMRRFTPIGVISKYV